jgi:hypothetical protein
MLGDYLDDIEHLVSYMKSIGYSVVNGINHDLDKVEFYVRNNFGGAGRVILGIDSLDKARDLLVSKILIKFIPKSVLVN